MRALIQSDNIAYSITHIHVYTCTKRRIQCMTREFVDHCKIILCCQLWRWCINHPTISIKTTINFSFLVLFSFIHYEIARLSQKMMQNCTCTSTFTYNYSCTFNKINYCLSILNRFKRWTQWNQKTLQIVLCHYEKRRSELILLVMNILLKFMLPPMGNENS